MMPVLPIASAQASGQESNPEAGMVLRAVQLVHSDGTSETAYIQLPAAASATKAPAHQKVHSHMILIYLAVGTIALSLSAYATIKMLSKNKN